MNRIFLYLLLTSRLLLGSEFPARTVDPFTFGLNTNGKLTLLKDGITSSTFFVCGTNGGSEHRNVGFNTVYYELYSDLSPESGGKSYDQLFDMWHADLKHINEQGYAVIIYIHNHNHDRDSSGYFPLDAEWRSRITRFVREFKDLPNLAGWAFSDEPSDHVGYPVAGYRRFLEAKYSTIDALNTAWETNFSSFEEIAFPYKNKEGGHGNGIPLAEASNSSYLLGVSRKSFDAADYKLFRLREAHLAFESAVRSEDPTTPLWSGAHNLAWAATQVPAGWGAWSDAYPTYSGNDWYTHHIWFQSILRGQNYRPVVPMFMVETSNSDLSKKWNLDPRVWGGWMVQSALQGSSGIAFWPWSLLAEAESPNQTATAVQRREFGGKTIRQLEGSGVYDMKPENTIAVLYQPYAEGWAGVSQVYGLLAKTGDEPLGLIEGLTFGTPNGSVDYLTNDSLLDAELEAYGLILVPFGADIPSEVQERLTEFVKNGGILLADLGFSSKNAEGHLASMTDEAKDMFGISQIKPSRMEGRWKLTKHLPKILTGADLSLPDDFAIRAQLAVTPTTAKPLLEGADGQGLFLNSYGSGYALFFSGQLWTRQTMSFDVIQDIHLALFKHRSKVSKGEQSTASVGGTMLNEGYQIFKYTTGYAVANLEDVEKDVQFEIEGSSFSAHLKPRQSYLFMKEKHVEMGPAFYPAPAISK